MNHLQKNKQAKADSLFQKAFAAHNAGELKDAESLYRKALRETPSDMETLYLLGTVCAQLGKIDEAAKFLTSALKIAPDHVEALNSMGLTLRGQKKLAESAAHFRRAVELRPDYVDALSNLGSVLELDGKLDEAEPPLRLALKLHPDMANAHYNLGLVLSRKDKFEEAALHFVRGLELMPDLPSAYSELGGIYKRWGRLEQALTCFDRGLTMAPDAHFLHSNRGAALEELGRFDEALNEYEIATKLFPADTTARWNSAYLYLRQGILNRGWELHDLRLDAQGQVSERFPFPRWDGSSLEDKTILIYAEQGLGDEIWLASCVPDLIAKAKHCVLECTPRLAPLFARSFPQVTVVGGDRLQIGWVVNVPKIDVQVAMGSMPRYLRSTLESFPKTRRYLVADTERTEYWRSRLALLGPGLKVGICWRSGLIKGERHKNYSQLTQWGEIFKVPGVDFVNLQYDECADELREVEEKFGAAVSVFPELDMKNELDETTALINSLDLVISAGTAVSELAGAAGVEIYRLDLFGKAMDALGTGASPWHPSMRLFSQLTPGDWETPLALVAETLKEKVLGLATTTEYVRLAQGVEVAVSGSIDDLPAYVLKEQLGWFDPEYEFVLGIAQPDMRIVDAGAGLGAYSIPLGHRVSGGRLWAFTGSAADANLMMKSRSRNGLEQRLSIAIADQEFSLDAEMDKHGLDDVGLVRLAGELCSADRLAGGAGFFSINSPLLMFGIRPGKDFDVAACAWLNAHGYDLYRLVPGLGLLVPFTSADELDVYSLNLFACKPDRADMLARQGSLIRQTHALDGYPGIDLKYWQDYLRPIPYAADKLDGWLSTRQKVKDWEVYWMALNLFAMAKSESRPAAERYACLQAAGSVMRTLLQEQATMPRLLSLCRILTELGRREEAVALLNRLCELLSSGMARSLDEPCLALTQSFASVAPGQKDEQWSVAMILAQRERLRAFSTFFTGTESLAALEEVRASGFGDEEIDRRITLIKTRFGISQE